MVHLIRLLLAIATISSAGCSRQSSPAVDMSPASWINGELELYSRLNQIEGQPRIVDGEKAIIAGITNALALRAGLEALKQGGSAVDAVMTAALTEITIAAGGPVSYSGELAMAYYEAASGRVYTMDATYNTPLEEEDPAGIPPQGTPSGRATLVPGFIAGVSAAHERFGSLPFEQLFQPAIYFAEQGFVLDKTKADLIEHRREVITRYPDGRRIFLKEDGSLYGEGDRFRQPELAETLKRLSLEGPDYFYRGNWARRFVATLRSHGGKMTLRDLDTYRVVWPKPVSAQFREYTIFGPGLPGYGGISVAEAFNLFELANLKDLGHYSTSPESLYRLVQISQVADLLNPPLIGTRVPHGLIDRHLTGFDPSPESRVRKDSARLLWEKMQNREAWQVLKREAAEARRRDSSVIENLTKGFSARRPKNTAGTVAVDEEGNMAVIIHSINSNHWGETGLFVDGVSINDAGAFQQDLMAEVGPGARVPTWDNPTIVLKGGKPFLGCTSIGGNYHEVNLQKLLNVLEFGMDPEAAAAQPQIRKQWPPVEPIRQPVGPGEIPADVLEAARSLGLDIEIVESVGLASWGGYWVGVWINPQTSRLQGGITSRHNGMVEGY